MITDNISDELKIYELSLIWKEAEYNFAFWEKLNGTLDWDKAYREALPRVLATTNLYDYYMELMRFVALLRDGHTGVWFPQAVESSAEYTAKLPINTQLIGGERVITNVKRCVADKIKRWSIIKKINGIGIDEYIEKNIYPYIWHEKKDSADFRINNFLSSGAAGSVAEFETEHDGKIETIALTRTKGDVDWVYDNAMTKSSENMQQEYKSDSHSIALTDDNIAIITIETFGNDKLPEEFYANQKILENMRGFIIDVRNNGGGNSGNSDDVAKAFIDGEFQTSRDLKPVYIGTYKAWGKWQNFGDKSYEEVVAEHGRGDWWEKCYKIPKHIYYEEGFSNTNHDGCPFLLNQPLVVLSSCNTGSASEDFLIELDNVKRATIVGTASYGSTGQPLLVNLESGGGFRICTRNCTYPDGRKFIDVGVQPHVKCELTLGDYKNGVDSVMNKGLEEVRKLIK